jgi:hypothetical protein
VGDVRGTPDVQVGGRIADIFEALFAVAGNQGIPLVCRSKVLRLGAEHLVEDAQMVGHLACKPRVGSRCEHQVHVAQGFLALEPGHQRLVEGKRGDDRRCHVGDAPLEIGFSLQQPEQRLQEQQGLVAQHQEDALDQQVRSNQRSVEVDRDDPAARSGATRSCIAQAHRLLKRSHGNRSALSSETPAASLADS